MIKYDERHKINQKDVQWSGQISAKNLEEAKKTYRTVFNSEVVETQIYKKATPTSDGIYGIWFRAKSTVNELNDDQKRANKLNIRGEQLRLAEKHVGAKVTDNFTGDMRGNILEFDDGSEWLIFDSEGEARDRAIELVEEDLKNEPELFNQDWLAHYIDEDRLQRDLWDDVYNMNYESVSDDPEFYDLTEKDVEDESEAMTDKVEEMTDSDLSDPIQYIKDIYGDDEGIKKAMEIGGIDIKEASEDAIITDGVAHFLSTYDGNEVELSDGSVMYRVN